MSATKATVGITSIKGEQMNLQPSTLVVVKTHWIMKVFSVLGVLLFGVCIIGSIRDHESIATIGIFAFFAIGSFLLWFLSNSFIAISNEKILVSVIYGRFQIRWAEVISIETNGSFICFSGQDKRVVISLSLANRVARQAVDLIHEQCRERHIEIRNVVTVPLTHHNSRVP
jgi:hypothetical protein